MGKLSQPDFDAVNAYAFERIQAQGDVYGWAPLEENGQPRVLLLVSENAVPESFPPKIGDVQLVILPIAAPERTRRYADN